MVVGEVPAHVVAYDDVAVCFLGDDPAAHGHVVVVPRRHTEDLRRCDGDLAGEIMLAVHRVAALL